VQGHKTAKAAPSSSEYTEGVLFSGWTREGYWANGVLLRGKHGAPISITKYLLQKPQEAPQQTQTRPKPSREHYGLAIVLDAHKRLTDIPSFTDLEAGWDVR